MLNSSYKTCLIDIDRASEFSGDDVDQYSNLVDLGRPYRKLTIVAPTLTSSALNVYVQRDSSVATVPFPLHHGQVTGATPAWGTAIWVTTAGTGDCTITVDMGYYQFIRIRATTNQAADRTLYLCGVEK